MKDLNLENKQRKEKSEETLKERVIEILELQGFECLNSKDFISSLFLKQKVFSKQYVNDSIYKNRKYKSDFIVHNAKNKGFSTFCLDCRWQSISGTVDEKYPYFVANIKEKCEYPTIIILDGGGYKEGAKEWLMAQIDKQKLLAVYDLQEFKDWINNE